MKKILLLSIVAFSFLAADAQTKKSGKKAKKPSKEAIAKAKYTKLENEKKLTRQLMLDSLMINDSLRLQNDSLADVQKEADRIVYKETGLRAIDSSNKESYKNLIRQRASWERTEKSDADVAKAAKLSDYEAKQVKYINQQYNEKAKLLLQGGDVQSKKTELMSLNLERRSKIKTIVGKSREKRLEKERKSYISKNGADADSVWMDQTANL
ncbi:MAG: hypothetical protein WKF88_07585 [Ferruginibacter sp.]